MMKRSGDGLDAQLPDTTDKSTLVDDNLQLYHALHNGSGLPCTKPWISLEERSSSGLVKPCCWSRGGLGQIRDEHDVPTIWHGKSYRTLRRTMNSGSLPSECPHWCPLLSARHQWFQKQEFYEYSREELLSFDIGFLANRVRMMKAILSGDTAYAGSRRQMESRRVLH